MKKLPKLLVLSLLTIGLTGCNGDNNNSSSSTGTSSTTSSSTSSSETVGQKHSINTPNHAGVSVNVSKSEAVAGDKVSFTLDFDSSYHSVSGIKVMCGTSTVTTKIVLKNGTPTYTFTMPDGDVNILIDEITDYAYANVKVDAFTHVAFSVDDVDVITNEEDGIVSTDAIQVGKKVTMTLSFDDDRILKGQPTFSLDCGLTTVTDGVCYTFTMPAAINDGEYTDLEIELQSKDNEVLFHSIKSVSGVSSYVDENSITGVVSGSSIKQGRKVSVSAKMAKTAKNLGLGVSVNETVTYLTQSSTDTTLYEGEFVMPEVDADVKIIPLTNRATEEEIAAGDYTTINITSSDIVTYYGIVSGEKYYCGSDNRASYLFASTSKRGDYISSIKYGTTGSTSTISASYYSSDNYYKLTTYMCNSTARGNSITTTINAESTGVHKFSLDSSNADQVEISSDSTDYAYGESLVINATAKDGYYLNGVDSIVGTSGKKYTASSSSGYGSSSSSSSNTYTFSNNKITFKSAPTEDITIKFKVIKKVDVTAKKVSGVSDIKFGCDTSDTETTALVPGKKFLVHFTLDDASTTTITNVKLGDVSLTKDSTSTSGNVVSFACWSTSSLTSGPIALTYELINIHTITLASSDRFTIVESPYVSSTSNKVTAEYKDATIKFKVKENTGYKIDSVTIAEDSSITVTQDTKDLTLYSFTMPDKDVTISVNTTQVNTHKVTVSTDNGITDLTITNKYGEKLDPTSTALDNINDGEKLTLKFSVSNGFTLTTFKYGDTDITATLASESKGVKNYTAEITTSDEAKTLTLATTEAVKNDVLLTTMDACYVIDSATLTNTTTGGTTIEENPTQVYAGNKVKIKVKLTNDCTTNATKTITADSFSVKCNNLSETVAGTFSTSDSYYYYEFEMPSSAVVITIYPLDYPTASVTYTDNCNEYLDVYYGYTVSSGDTPLDSIDKFKVGVKAYCFKIKSGKYDSTKIYTLEVVDQDGITLKWLGSGHITDSSYTSYRPIATATSTTKVTTSITVTLTISDKA
jgi:hypothetical protein